MRLSWWSHSSLPASGRRKLASIVLEEEEYRVHLCCVVRTLSSAGHLFASVLSSGTDNLATWLEGFPVVPFICRKWPISAMLTRRQDGQGSQRETLGEV